MYGNVQKKTHIKSKIFRHENHNKVFIQIFKNSCYFINLKRIFVSFLISLSSKRSFIKLSKSTTDGLVLFTKERLKADDEKN